jgi:uncharacterized protein YecT (DUF1311 family)
MPGVILAAAIAAGGPTGAGATSAAITVSIEAACWKKGNTFDVARYFAASGRDADGRLNHLYQRVVNVLDPNSRNGWKAHRLSFRIG